MGLPEGSKYITESDGKQFVELPNGETYPCTGYVGQVKSAYMCATDFEHEVGEADHTGPLCDSVESLRKARPCVDECGWVRVLLVAVEFSQPKTEIEEE